MVAFGVRRARRVAGILVAGLLLAACTARTPAPPPEPEDPSVAADRLVAGLSSGDLRDFPATVDAQAELGQILAGMDGILPTVTHGEVRRTGKTAEIPLSYSWPFAAAPWEYTSTGTLIWTDNAWRLQWTAGMIHPYLTSQTRLVHTPRPAPRGRILDSEAAALAEERPVVRIGLYKSLIPPEQWDSAARRLATMLGVDPDRFAERVRAYGPEAFVEAITLRHDAPQPDGWRELPGAVGLQDQRALALDREFAPEIIGTVGPASVEQAAQAGPTVLVGDPIGQSGLQRRLDQVLRGQAGAIVQLAPRKRPPGAVSNAPSPAARPTEPPRTTLFEVAPAQGKDLHTTFDSALQRRAERAVAAVAGPAAVVALRPSDGAIRAAAVSPGPDPEATFGHFAPGATFRIVTALALLRAGRPVNSLADSPSAADISTEELRRAAASLGLGVDYEAGFSSFFGEIGDGVAGGAQVSPMAMAAVVGSIAAGRTVLPRLIEGYDPPEPTVPLTAAEAEALRALLPDKEFGSSTWYLGYSGDLAVAVWVREGDSAAAREALHALLR